MLLIELETVRSSKERVRRHLQVAELYEKLGDLPNALEQTGLAVVDAPDDEVRRAKLRELAERTGRLDRLADLLSAAAASAQEGPLQIGLVMQAASIRADRVGDAAGGIALYSSILVGQGVPEESVLAAARELEPLLEATGRDRGAARRRRAHRARRARTRTRSAARSVGRRAWRRSSGSTRAGSRSGRRASRPTRATPKRSTGWSICSIAWATASGSRRCSTSGLALRRTSRAAAPTACGWPSSWATCSTGPKTRSSRGAGSRTISARRKTRRSRSRRSCARRAGGRSWPRCSSAASSAPRRLPPGRSCSVS